jgi:hypothetical protein
VCDEGEASADGQWLLGHPGNAINIGVPVWNMTRIGDVAGHHLTRSGDVYAVVTSTAFMSPYTVQDAMSSVCTMFVLGWRGT